MYELDSDWRACDNTPGNRGCGPLGFCIHHSAGLTLDMAPTFLANSTSAHYGIKDSRVRQFVEDGKGAWAAGNYWANISLLHIECVNSGGDDEGWPVAEQTVGTLVEFLADKCREYGFERLEIGKNLFGHRDFYATFCPGVLYERLGEIADRVNANLKGEDDMTPAEVAQAVWGYNYNDSMPGGNCYNALEWISRNTSEMANTDASGAENEMGEHVDTGATMPQRLAYMEARQMKMERTLAAIAEKMGV